MLFEQGASEADSLNDQWDTWKTISGKYDTAGWLPQIGKLHAMIRPPHTSALDRVWRNVQRRNSISTIATRNLGSSKVPQPQRRDWSRTVMPTRIALTAILLIVMAIPIGLGPARHLFEDDGALSTMPALGPSTATAMASSSDFTTYPLASPSGDAQVESSGSMFGIEDVLVQPRMSPTGVVEVGFWEVQIPTNKGFRFDPRLWEYGDSPGWIGIREAIDDLNQTPGIVFLGRSMWDGTPLDKLDQQPFLVDGVINRDPELRTVFVLVPSLKAGTPPLVDSAPENPPLPVEPSVDYRQLGSFELNEKDAYQFLVSTNEINQVANGDTIFTGLPGTPEMAYVDEGPFEAGSPLASPEVEAGRVFQAGPASELRVTTARSGLAFTSLPKSDNPTLNQTEKAIAPMGGQLFIEGMGQFGVEFDLIKVEPGGWFNQSGSAAALYFLADGSLSLSVPEDQADSKLPVGATVFQEPEKLFTFRNETEKPAEILMLIVYPYELPDWAVPYGEGSASRSGVTVTTHFVEKSLLSLRGLHDVQFAVGSAESTPELLKSHFHEQGVALVAPWEGNIGITVTGNGGVIMTPPSEVGQGIPSDSDTESIVRTGSYLWSSSASGFAVQGVAGPPLAWVLLITPADE